MTEERELPQITSIWIWRTQGWCLYFNYICCSICL